VDPQVVRERMNFLEERYLELISLAETRRLRLENNKRLCQFWWDLADIENHLRDQEQVLALGDTGRDIISVNWHLAKHRNAENNLADLGRGLDALDVQGQQLILENIPGAEHIPDR